MISSHHKGFCRLAAWALIALFVGGCQYCEPVAPGSTPPIGPDELTGPWQVTAAAIDAEGCHPEDAAAPIDQLEIRVEGEDQTSSPHRRLHLFPCPTADRCAGETSLENELRWNADHNRGEQVHHYANLVHNSPLETTCRLSTIRVLLIADGSELELTRSYYSIDLPIEGDEACTDELADQYHAHMSCDQSEILHLQRFDSEGDDADDRS